MTDSHCHLDHCADPHGAVDPTLAAIVTIGTTLERSRAAVRLAETYPNVWAAVGIHPNDAGDAGDPEVRGGIERLARHPRVVAIGETGFDTYWDAVPLDVQRESFTWQARLALETDKALILHVRDRQNDDAASRAAESAIREAGLRRGILHCFNGDPGLLEAGLELGWMVSFAGNATYRNASPLRAAAGRVPLERLLVETDSPFLAPEPKRGRKNTPAFVRFTAERLALERRVPIDEFERATDANARRVYGIPERE